MTRFLDIVFRNKFRLLVLLLLLPAVLAAVNLYFQRSFAATEVVWVNDPGVFGQAVAGTGYNNYLSPAQNANQALSALIGTQRFKDALGDKLVTSGAIATKAQRAAVIASLDQLTASTVITGAASSGAGSGGGGGSAAQHTLTLRYACRSESLCLQVLSVVLDVYRVQQADINASSAAAAREVYQKQEVAAVQDLVSAVAAVRAYEAAHPVKAGQAQTATDPRLASLQHEVDLAEGNLDKAKQRLGQIDLIQQVSDGMTTSMRVVDGPALEKGMFGIRGFRNENLKTDGIVAAACVAAAAIYIVLVAFLDRTIRDPSELRRRFGAQVVTVPEHRMQRSGAGRHS